MVRNFQLDVYREPRSDLLLLRYYTMVSEQVYIAQFYIVFLYLHMCIIEPFRTAWALNGMDSFIRILNSRSRGNAGNPLRK